MKAKHLIYMNINCFLMDGVGVLYLYGCEWAKWPFRICAFRIGIKA